MNKILSNGIDDTELLGFTIENIDGYLNIRIHRGITGEMRFGVDKK